MHSDISSWEDTFPTLRLETKALRSRYILWTASRISRLVISPLESLSNNAKASCWRAGLIHDYHQRLLERAPLLPLCESKDKSLIGCSVIGTVLDIGEAATFDDEMGPPRANNTQCTKQLSGQTPCGVEAPNFCRSMELGVLQRNLADSATNLFTG